MCLSAGVKQALVMVLMLHPLRVMSSQSSIILDCISVFDVLPDCCYFHHVCLSLNAQLVPLLLSGTCELLYFAFCCYGPLIIHLF